MAQEPGPEPIKAWFRGPQDENAQTFRELIDQILERDKGWRENYAPAQDPRLISTKDHHENRAFDYTLRDNLAKLLDKLKSEFPYFSPRYIGHMLSEVSMPAMLGYFAAMLRNPNNVTPEAASVTVGLELEVGELVSAMLGLDAKKTWAHICSGGTIANLEALWVARAVQMVPLCLHDLCTGPFRKLGLAKTTMIKNPNGDKTSLEETGKDVLVSLRPAYCLALWDSLKKTISNEESEDSFDREYAASKFNIKTRGLWAVQKELGLKPIIFVSSAAHYSIGKVAQVLGYGDSAIKKVPVDNRFRIDAEQLAKSIQETLREHSGEKPQGETELPLRPYVAAVVGTVGTTEEGAVDPVQRIVKLRNKMEAEANKSFWLHVDAAWGGYFASCFNRPLADGGCEWVECPEISATVENPVFAEVFKRTDDEAVQWDERTVQWDDPDVRDAFTAMKEADSITIDPHKTGYVPYPAGMVVFCDSRVKKLQKQRAQYIDGEGMVVSRGLNLEESIGPYIIEGSKPGAAAAACWLAHKTMPLHAEGHGQVMRECLLNAQKLNVYLKEHKRMFHKLEEEHSHLGPVPPFTFRSITNPDTNVVTFVAGPTKTEKAEEKDGDPVFSVRSLGMDLEWVNELNQAIHKEFSILVKKSKPDRIQSTEFFLSHTKFKQEQYTSVSLERLLKDIDVSAEDYKKHGLYLLRATVMNPFYRFSEGQDDLLFELIRQLHRVARNNVNRLWSR